MARSKVSLCLKYLIFFVNVFFWIMGCAMISIGTWAYLHKNQFSFAVDEKKGAFDFVFDAAVVMVLVGVIVFILSFAGLVGALRENTCLLRFFYISLIIVFLSEMVAITLAFVFSANVQPILASVMKEEALTRYFDDADLMNMIDFFQKELRCCGIGREGYLDWNNNPYFRCADNSTTAQKCSVPFSCCRDPISPETGMINTMCGYGTLSLTPFVASERIFTSGCMTTALDLAVTNLHILGGIALALALSQLATIFLARRLEDQIKDQKMTVAFSGY